MSLARFNLSPVALATALFLGSIGAGNSCCCGQDNGTSSAPRLPATLSSVDPASLNLWTRNGRPKTFVDRETREALEQVDILDRPNRPFHFYGNTVRRRTYGSSGSFSLMRRD